MLDATGARVPGRKRTNDGFPNMGLRKIKPLMLFHPRQTLFRHRHAKSADVHYSAKYTLLKNYVYFKNFKEIKSAHRTS